MAETLSCAAGLSSFEQADNTTGLQPKANIKVSNQTCFLIISFIIVIFNSSQIIDLGCKIKNFFGKMQIRRYFFVSLPHQT
ncbi:hypothetical protein [Xylanibacter ruminicola]|uniref:hypothetical protein n=1 Tax=Xylanibacter ruminicola TaxID=839 RepID=UPI000691722E|nr:hypothetical protein [Xylanibacter ruminicola]